MLYSVLSLLVAAPQLGPIISNADPRANTELRDRDIENVRLLRTRVVPLLPESTSRDPAVLALDETLKPLALRKTMREVPLFIQHVQGKGVDTAVFLASGPQDDPEYDPNGAAAKLYFEPQSNPAGIKLTLTRKAAQLCDLLLVIEDAKKHGQAFFHGVPVAKLLPGLNALVLITFGHEAMHAAQYQMRPVLDLDSHRSKIKDGFVPPELLNAAKWERAYEYEAYAWEYALAVKMKTALSDAAAAITELRKRDAAEFTGKNARWEYLADHLRNELVQHYINDVIAAAEKYAKTNTITFTGIMHFWMDAMVEVPEVTDALAAANNDAIEGGAKRIQALRKAITRAEMVRRAYYEQGESTERMLALRPFLGDVRLRLDREIDRAKGRLTGR